MDKTNNEHLEDIAGVGSGSKMTNNQLLEIIAAGGGNPGGTGGVTSVNGKTDDVTITAGDNVTVDNSGDTIVISSQASGSSGVTSVNGQTGEVVLDADDVGAVDTDEMNAAIQDGLGSVGFINGSTMPLDYEFTSKTISILPGDNGQVLGTVNDAVTGMTVTWVDTPKAEFVDPSTGTMADVINALIDAGLMSSE